MILLEWTVTMSQTQPTATSLFRTSLRDWQADWKARQASQAPEPEAAPEPTAPTRVKRLVAYKARRMRRASSPSR